VGIRNSEFGMGKFSKFTIVFKEACETFFIHNSTFTIAFQCHYMTERRDMIFVGLTK